MAVSIVAVDDHPIVVEGLLAVIARSAPTLHLTRSTSGWPEMKALLDAGDLHPDLALVDLNRGDGTEPEAAVEGFAAVGVPVVVLTSELRPVPLRRAIAAGALGLVLKSDPIDQILDVLRAALRGESHASSDLAFVLLSDPQIQAKLAPREIEALSLLADGWPRKSVGARMSPPVSTSTVITYINRAIERYRGLGRPVGTITDAIREATADGFLDTPNRVLKTDD